MKDLKDYSRFKKLTLIFVFFFAVFFPSAIIAVDIPSSARSREAISRVEASLKDKLSRSGLKYGSPVFMRIFKDSLELELWIKDNGNFKLFQTYKICTFGYGGLGPKIRQGDGMAPEGFYYVTPKQLNPVSTFHLSFNLGYPNTYDRSHGRTGSALMVHGSCVSIGCYAMTDKCIEEIFALIVSAFENGQKYFRIHIFPFQMTSKNMNMYQHSKWYDFWKNLKQGYDFFENNGYVPPNVTVRNQRYCFEFSK